MTSSWSKLPLLVMSLLIVGRFTWSLGVGPLLEKRSRMRTMRTQVSELEHRRLQLDRDRESLNLIASRAIAPDPMRVAVGYQTWLLELGRELEIDDLSVKPCRPLRFENLGDRVPLLVRATTDAESIGKLVDHIEQSNSLHTLRHISIETQRGGQQVVSMVLDAMAMRSAKPGSGTLAETTAVSRIGRDFAHRRPFHRYVEPKPASIEAPKPEPVVEPTPTVTKVVSVNHFEGVRYVGTWSSADGRRTALFSGPATETGYAVNEHDTLEIGNQSCVVEEVGRDFVAVRFDEQHQRVEIGELVVARRGEVH